jgi:putrescine transport system substrate-binding protein
MLFDPAIVSRFADCGVQVLDSADDMLPAALNYLGLPPDSKNSEDLQKAGDLLKSVTPHIQKFHSSEYINGLANGDICLAVGYSGDILQARDRAAEAANNVTVEYAIPKEGALMWLDSFAIPADAPHSENALAFINFMLKPDIAARNSNYVYYANGNEGSQDQLNDDVIGDPAIYPDEATVSKLFTTTPNDPRTQREVTRIWTEVKTGQ